MFSMDLEKLLTIYENFCFSLFKDFFDYYQKADNLNKNEKEIVNLVLSLDKKLLTNSTFICLLFKFIQLVEKKEFEQLSNLKEEVFIELNCLLIKLKLKSSFTNTYNKKFFSREFQNTINIGEIITISNSKSLELISGVKFIQRENNPFLFESNNNIDFADISKEKWIEEFSSALNFIKFETPDIYNRIIPFLDSIGPLGFENFHQNSLSLMFSPKVIYLSYVQDYVVQAEAIIHEVYHSIIDIFAFFDSGVKNSLDEIYYSSVQKRPRPIQNCILALHAFVAVENFYKILLQKEILTKEEYFLRLFIIYHKNEELLLVINKYADFTDNGLKFFEEINREHLENKIFILQLINENSKFKNLFESQKSKVLEHKEEVKNFFPNILF